jgi:hypothetical protein
MRRRTMTKERVNKLTEALESAGFEIVSLKEETGRHLLTEHDLRGDMYVRGYDDRPGGTCVSTGWTLAFKSGSILLEIMERQG